MSHVRLINHEFFSYSHQTNWKSFCSIICLISKNEFHHYSISLKPLKLPVCPLELFWLRYVQCKTSHWTSSPCYWVYSRSCSFLPVWQSRATELAVGRFGEQACIVEKWLKCHLLIRQSGFPGSQKQPCVTYVSNSKLHSIPFKSMHENKK